MKNKQEKITIAAVPIGLLPHVWPKCIKHFKKTIADRPNEITLKGLYDDFINDRSLLIIISAGRKVIATIVLETVVFHTGFKVLYIPIIAGERMCDWDDDIMIFLHNAARSMECDEIRGLSIRKGWERKLEKYGFKNSFTTLYLTINK